jgi:hypothetical protein
LLLVVVLVVALKTLTEALAVVLVVLDRQSLEKCLEAAQAQNLH